MTNERVVMWSSINMGGGSDDAGYSLFSIKDDVPEPGSMYDKAWETSAWRPLRPGKVPCWGSEMVPNHPDLSIVF